MSLTFSNPTPNFYILISSDVKIASSGKMPNIFHRFMIRLMFGWKIECLK